MHEDIFADSIIHDMDYKTLVWYEEAGYIPVCTKCRVNIVESLSEFDVVFSIGKPLAVAVKINEDKAEFYCKKCFDKICC